MDYKYVLLVSAKSYDAEIHVLTRRVSNCAHAAFSKSCRPSSAPRNASSAAAVRFVYATKDLYVLPAGAVNSTTASAATPSRITRKLKYVIGIDNRVRVTPTTSIPA
jgi:hypothetical protein